MRLEFGVSGPPVMGKMVDEILGGSRNTADFFQPFLGHQGPFAAHVIAGCRHVAIGAQH